MPYRLAMAQKMAVRTGLEPATSCVTGRHSNQLNYRTRLIFIYKNLWHTEVRSSVCQSDDPYGIRTRVTAVKGRCLNHLTNGPCYNGGEGGIWTLAPAKPTYTLSRGASSATWVLLHMAPQVGFEPTTDRLTADCSTTELLWNRVLQKKNQVRLIFMPKIIIPQSISIVNIQFKIRCGFLETLYNLTCPISFVNKF